MGAVFFMIFLAVMFFVAIFFIILSITTIVIWNTRKRKGKNPKKWWRVIATILLIVNTIVALVPVGYIGFLRYANNSNKPDVIYAESGNIVYWPMGDYEPTTNWFELDGVKYVRFREGFSNDSFFLDYADDKLEEPIANIKYKQSDSNPFNNFMWILLSGSTYADQNISTIYPVKNDNGFEFVYVKNSPGSASMAGGTFCIENKLDHIKAYYSDISNYDTQNLSIEYAVYTDGEEQSGKRGDSAYVNIEKAIALNEGTFEILDYLYWSGGAPERIEIPEKYYDIDKAAVPGTPIFGFDERQLFAYSKDEMAYRHVYLVLIENQIYAETGSGAGYINGYPLPIGINQYIIDNVFRE